jgi:hypothetical protein
MSAIRSCVTTLPQYVTRFGFKTHISNCPAKKGFLQVAVSNARLAKFLPLRSLVQPARIRYSPKTSGQ